MKQFISKCIMKKHVRTTHEEGYHSGMQCDNTKFSKDNLREHVELIQEKDSLSFQIKMRDKYQKKKIRKIQRKMKDCKKRRKRRMKK